MNKIFLILLLGFLGKVSGMDQNPKQRIAMRNIVRARHQAKKLQSGTYVWMPLLKKEVDAAKNAAKGSHGDNKENSGGRVNR